MNKVRWGHKVYGLGAFALGVITLVWHQIDSLGSITHPDMLVYAVAAVEVTAGLAMQWQRTMRLGAITSSAVFFVFAFYWVPQIFKTPLDFAPWGNLGEQFSMVVGAVIAISTLRSNPERWATMARVAYGGFGICVVSYSLYQLFYATYTASLVPQWIPPGQMFWTIATSIAFGLAAVALLSGRLALLASRLLTMMLILFGVLVWLPRVFASPHELSNWREFVENLLIAGSSWIVVDFLAQPTTVPTRWPFSPPKANQKVLT